MATPLLNKSPTKGKFTDLKHRLFFVVIALIVFRIGSFIPLPGLDLSKLPTSTGGILGMFNMLSGGAFQHFSLFALGVMPYISASIIMQLLSTVTPSLEAIKKEGESGQRKINRYTRYGTVILAFFQGLGIAKMLEANHAAMVPGFGFDSMVCVTLVAGTMFLMWLGEQITEYGIGNGVSLIIFAGIVDRLPSAIKGTINNPEIHIISMALILVAVLAVIAIVVFMERGQRRIAINYATRQQGNKMYSAKSSYLPLKINMSGVIPAIFATSIILFPASIAGWFHNVPGLEWLANVSVMLQMGSPLYIVVFAAAVIFFSFFYTALVFNPKETAENLKKSGAFIPGIRPGEKTAQYIDDVTTRLTLAGALYVTLVCLVPEFMVSVAKVNFYFGGTSLLIVVVVVIDFYTQVQSHLMSSQYESRMKDGFRLFR